MKIKIEELKVLIMNKIAEKNYSKIEAEKIAEVLLFAELTGKDTQGILKLLGTEPIQNVQPFYAPKIIKETKLATLLDGGGNASPLVCQMATNILIKKCKENGMAIVGTNNAFASSGAIGFYAHKIAKNNLIGLVFAGSPGGVAPFGSIEPLFGTNPMAFGFPTENDPLIFDMATAAITWYGLVRAQTLGKEIPQGIAIDNEGNITTDPEKAMNGAILPFDKSYKSSGLSMMIEILTGPLVGGTFATPDGKGDWSNLFIAIDPDQLVGTKEFKRNCSELILKTKSSKKQKGFNEIFVPGEQGLKLKKEYELTGEIDIDSKIINELQTI